MWDTHKYSHPTHISGYFCFFGYLQLIQILVCRVILEEQDLIKDEFPELILVSRIVCLI